MPRQIPDPVPDVLPPVSPHKLPLYRISEVRGPGAGGAATEVKTGSLLGKPAVSEKT